MIYQDTATYRNHINYETRSNIMKTILIIIGLMLFIGVPFAMYTHEETHTITVYSINQRMHVYGSDGDTYSSYEYLVSTDKGVFKIDPDGIFHSSMFGKLEVGKTYTVKTRGYSVPLLGIYPNIIDEF